MRNLDILAAENGEHVRVLLCGEEQSYVVSCQHFRMPYPVASDLLAELQPVPAETYSVFVLDEDITNRQREGRNRKLDLIAPLLVDTCIYDKSHRNEVVRRIAAAENVRHDGRYSSGRGLPSPSACVRTSGSQDKPTAVPHSPPPF